MTTEAKEYPYDRTPDETIAEVVQELSAIRTPYGLHQQCCEGEGISTVGRAIIKELRLIAEKYAKELNAQTNHGRGMSEEEWGRGVRCYGWLYGIEALAAQVIDISEERPTATAFTAERVVGGLEDILTAFLEHFPATVESA